MASRSQLYKLQPNNFLVNVIKMKQKRQLCPVSWLDGFPSNHLTKVAQTSFCSLRACFVISKGGNKKAVDLLNYTLSYILILDCVNI